MVNILMLLCVRLGSTEQSEIGSVENSKGNTKLTEFTYTDGTALSTSARCIGSFEDSAMKPYIGLFMTHLLHKVLQVS